MALFKSGNPALSESKFRDTILDNIVTNENAMTVKGTLNKFGVLFLLMLASSYYSWKEAAQGGDAWTLILIGVFGGLAVAFIMAFKKQWSQYLAPAYALLEGLFVGAISAYFEYAVPSTQEGYAGGYSGIVLQAVGLTFAVVAVMFLLYKFKVIQATPTFKKVIIIATISIGVFYLVCWIITLVGSNAPSFIFQSTPIGIGFSVFVVALASLNLILDFDMIEKGAEMGAPKYMEWYGAFGLLVTIVWLYMEILRLLSKLNRR
ncbi:MAG: Bax inhibitor-1/YccA family protein [Bacteroidetes bacterium]|nr:Bax inhibitor-1/YccA family protein [Bacteroidota bacterium]MBS1755856.1 Bax inhibitor-1/YccA family protein [Bacteroidota bacterium]